MFSVLAVTLSNIGAFLLEMEHCEEALHYFQEALNAFKNDIKEYKSSDENSRASFDERLRKSIELEKNLRESFAGTAKISQTHLALYRLNNRDDCLSFPSRAIIIENDETDLNRNSAVCLHNIGLTHLRMASYEEAVRIFYISLSAAIPQKYPSVGIATLNNIGLIQYRYGFHDKALDSFLRALEIEGNVFNGNIGQEDNLQYAFSSHFFDCMANTLSSLGRLYFCSGQLDNALQMCHEELCLRRSVSSPDKMTVSATLFNRGLILFQKGKVEEALTLCNNFHHKLCFSSGSNCLQAATVLHEIGVMHNKNGNKNIAVTNLRKSLEIRRAIHRTDHVDVAETLRQLGTIMKSNFNYDTALPLLKEAKPMFISAFGNNNRNVAMVTLHLAELHHLKGNLEDALEEFYEVLRIAKIFFGEKDDFVANILVSIGNVKMEQGDAINAMSHFVEASRLISMTSGNHADPQEILKKLVSIYATPAA